MLACLCGAREQRTQVADSLLLDATGTTAQAGVPYTDPASGVTLSTWLNGGTAAAGALVSTPMTFGMTLPENAKTVDATDYIGLLVCGSTANLLCHISLSVLTSHSPEVHQP